MKIKIGKYTYRKASDLRKVMEKAPRNEKEVKLLFYLIGIYSCRMFGFVRYRSKAGFDTEKIIVNRKLSDCVTDEVGDGNCNIPHVKGCFLVMITTIAYKQYTLPCYATDEDEAVEIAMKRLKLNLSDIFSLDVSDNNNP